MIATETFVQTDHIGSSKSNLDEEISGSSSINFREPRKNHGT